MGKKQYRWECPDAKHQAVNGPGRPRMDDVRRYCLRCSETRGRLVKRVCPALQRMTAAKVQRRASKQVAAKQRFQKRQETYEQSYAGRLESAFRQYAKLKAWDSDLSNVDFRLRLSAFKTHTSGHAWGSCRIVITAGRNEAYAKSVMLHELAHIAHNRSHPRNRDSHGDVWRSYYAAAVHELTSHSVSHFSGGIEDLTQFVAQIININLRDDED